MIPSCDTTLRPSVILLLALGLSSSVAYHTSHLALPSTQSRASITRLPPVRPRVLPAVCRVNIATPNDGATTSLIQRLIFRTALVSALLLLALPPNCFAAIRPAVAQSLRTPLALLPVALPAVNFPAVSSHLAASMHGALVQIHSRANAVASLAAAQLPRASVLRSSTLPTLSALWARTEFRLATVMVGFLSSRLVISRLSTAATPNALASHGLAAPSANIAAAAVEAAAIDPPILPGLPETRTTGAAPHAKQQPARQAPSRRMLKMVVSGLPPHVSPSRLFFEFPQALQVEALIHKRSGQRASVVLTFDSASPPKRTSSPSLGAALNAVVQMPMAGSEYTRMAWRRSNDGERIASSHALPKAS
ncbi:hypothetical protein AB1Y20_003323 [Prymnesium parvum]|uniref:RRM domain-containing protein n=1 Tax=Prymnesium parvum TaxID=97485 RepID=A0AB34JDW6_PRYPA